LKYFYSIFIALLIAALVLLLALPAIRHSETGSQPNGKVVRDTIREIVHAKPITIAKIKAKIIRTSDTVIRFSPFKAIIDTVILHDTIKSTFDYPTGIFSLDIRRPPDTLMTERIRIYEPQIDKEKWWEKPMLILGSAAAGYMFGRIKK